MSYCIYIGEAVVRRPEDWESENTTAPELYVVVEEMERTDAPYSPDASGYTNGRHPGYSSMKEWTEAVGLYDLFFDKESGLMRQHPGCFALTREHLARITTARERWAKEHPETVDPNYEHHFMYLRLVWYEWWVKYALKNCQRPAIYNM